MINPKKYIYMAIAAISLFTSSISSFAYDAGSTSISYNGTIMKLNNISGVTAYSPYDKSHYGSKTQILSDLKKIKSSLDKGGNASTTAAQRYSGFSWTNSQYNFKISHIDGNLTSYIWKVAPYYIGETYNVSFRYAGIAKTLNSGNNIATDPDYTSDSLSQNSSAGNARSVSVWNNNTGSFEQKTAYGDKGGVHDLWLMKTNGMYGTTAYAGSSTIKTNKYTSANSASNGALAKQAFETWADTTEYGAAYKSLAQEMAPQMGLEWWQVLNRYFQIQGDITKYNTENAQSIFFYCVFDWEGTWYNTYTLPAKIQKNMSPTRLVIRDDQGVVCGNTYRDPIELK